MGAQATQKLTPALGVGVMMGFGSCLNFLVHSGHYITRGLHRQLGRRF